MTERYQVIGLMSGTSLDGVDLACCNFENKSKKWSFEIHCAETISYPALWKQRFSEIINTSAVNYVLTHVELGKFYGNLIQDFIVKNAIKPVLIASHGHTVFHQPKSGFTAQIGDGSQIAAITGVDTVCDFRSKDVALGGQGAPLVPAGELNLFTDYAYCLNLGGIANISKLNFDNTIAYDICPANMVLNFLAGEEKMPFDKDGILASRGRIDQQLLNIFNNLSYYQLKFPKSLGREWVEEEIKPILDGSLLSTADKLATFCEHIGMQIGKSIDSFTSNKNEKLLITGGGAFNAYLVNSIRNHTAVEIVIPDKLTISFKEALIFAFLGLCFTRNENNVLSSVTGAHRSHIGGALYKGN